VGGYGRNVGRTIEGGRRRKGRDGQGTREQGDGCATWFESFGTALWRHIACFARSFVSWSLESGVWSLEFTEDTPGFAVFPQWTTVRLFRKARELTAR
jgi:hypothetical protein